MAPAPIRELRRVLRYRNMIVREATRFKNKTAGLLMEIGAEYNKEKLHGKKYFSSLLKELEDIPSSVRQLLGLSHASVEVFTACQRRLVNALKQHPLLQERVVRLMRTRGVLPIASRRGVLIME